MPNETDTYCRFQEWFADWKGVFANETQARAIFNAAQPQPQKIVQTLEEALNQVVLCTDGEERRLVEIQDDLLHYEVEVNGGRWMRLSGTRRWEAEPLFVGGTFGTTP